MSSETYFESLNSKNSGSLATPVGMNTTNSSGRSSSTSLNQLSGLMATSGSKHYRLNSPHGDYNADSDHARITMKTRVTVRDKTPHRFQVVPLRDVSKPAASEGDSERPSQLALPLASHTLLRSASIRRQTFSQARHIIASSHSQVDLNAQDNYNAVTLADSETLATPCAEMLTIPSLELSPSFVLDNLEESYPLVLVEQDMNRRSTKSTIHEFECSITTPTNAPQSYDAHVQKPVALFSVRSPSIHITSQSLDLASCNSGTHPKISQGNTSEHLIANIQSSIKDSRSPRKKRTRSENIPSIRNNNQRHSRSRPAATVVKEGCDSGMTKRHAIYTQSLYVPFLELPSCFPGSSTKNREGRHQLFENHPNENISDSHRTHLQAFISDSETTTLPNTDPDDQSSSTTGLRDGEAAASEQSLQVIRASATVPHTGPHRGLNYRRLSRVYPLSTEAISQGKTVYPQIIREIFADVDRAILEWRHI